MVFDAFLIAHEMPFTFERSLGANSGHPAH
jgi:hypothetical protein